MRRDIAFTVGGCLLFIAVVMVAFVYSVVRDVGLTDEGLVERGAVILPRPREAAAVTLVDEDGQPWTTDSLATGNWTLAYFGFTNCPDICPVSLAVMAEARKLMDADGNPPFDVTLVSVDPERDTPDQLREFVRWFDDDFKGVTGDHGEIARLATSVNVAFGKVPGQTPENYAVDHTGNIIVINPYGHYHGFLKMPHEAPAIAEIMHTLTLRWQG